MRAGTLAALFEAAEVVETWLDHHTSSSSATALHGRLHRCAVFLYEVVCAFVIQDLDGLMQRHLRKGLTSRNVECGEIPSDSLYS